MIIMCLKETAFKFLFAALIGSVPLMAFGQDEQLEPLGDLEIATDQKFRVGAIGSVPIGEAKVIYTSRKYCVAMVAYFHDVVYAEGWLDKASDDEVNEALIIDIAPLEGCHSLNAIASPTLLSKPATYAVDSSPQDTARAESLGFKRAKILIAPSGPNTEEYVYLGSTTTWFETNCFYIVTTIHYYRDPITFDFFTLTSTEVIPSVAAGSCMEA